MSVLSKIDRKTLVIGSICAAVGFGIGVFLEQWLLWHRQVGRFNEMLRRLSILEDELLQMKVKLKQSRTPASQTDGKLIIPNNSKTSMSPRQNCESSDDEYVDFDSENDEYLSVASEQISTNSYLDLKKLYEKVDYLLDGPYQEKRDAYQLLREKRLEVNASKTLKMPWLFINKI